MIKETPADEDPSTGDDHQTTTDKTPTEDDAGAGTKTDDVSKQTVKANRPPEPPADWTASGKDPAAILADADKPQARSFLRKLLDLAFGAENEAKLEQELRAKSEADEAEEQARKDALEARRKQLQDRFQSISTRVEERGLV
jgi:hypothetical protein